MENSQRLKNELHVVMLLFFVEMRGHLRCSCWLDRLLFIMLAAFESNFFCHCIVPPTTASGIKNLGLGTNHHRHKVS